MKYSNPRMRCISISEKNRSKEEIVDDYATEWDLAYAPTLWRIVKEYDVIIKRLKSSKWQILQEVAKV